MRIKIFIYFILIFLGGCSQTPDIEIFYLQTNYGKNLNVYNYTSKDFSLEGVNYLENKNQKYGEFGGYFAECISQSFYCIAADVAVAIPIKLEGQTAWQIDDWNCSSDLPLSVSEPRIIECKYEGYLNNASSKFKYHPRRGVTEYYVEQEGDDALVYVLLGEFGLLSPTLHNKPFKQDF